MANPTFVSDAYTENNASGTVVANAPSGSGSNRLIIAHQVVANISATAATPTNALPAGWTALDSLTVSLYTGTYYVNLLVASAYYLTSGSEPATYTFTGSSAGSIQNAGAVYLEKWNQVDNTAPVNAHGLLQATTGSSIIAPAETSTIANAAASYVFWNFYNANIPSNPTGLTSTFTQANTTLGYATRASRLALTTAGLQPAQTATASGANFAAYAGGFGLTVLIKGSGGAIVALAGTSQQSPTATGTVSVDSPLTGTTSQQATNTAVLSRGVLLSSTSQQQASATGTLVAQVPLTGIGQQTASAYGTLTDTLSLTAISAQEASAFAVLSLGNPLSGTSAAQSEALASLLVAKGFSGITQAAPTASANLTVTAGIVVALAGVSFAQNSAFGALTGLNALVGVSAQSQVAYGQRSVSLQGISSAVQSAYAALSILLGTSGISSAEASARAILTVFAAGSGATMSTTTPSWVMTYDSLTQAVLQSLERSDTSTQNYVPTAITMAEFEIAQQIKTLGQLEVADTTLSPSNPILAKPARWRKTVSMTLVANGLKQPVLLRKLEYLSAYAQSVSAPGTPLFYADYDYDHWMFAPTPDIAYAIEALVYTRLEPLSSSNQTNWLTQNAPNALLFGALKQMMLFLKDDQRLPVFKGMFDEAMSTLKTEDTLRVGDRSAVAVDS